MIERDPKNTAGIVELLRPYGYRPYAFDKHAGVFVLTMMVKPITCFIFPPMQQGSLPIMGPRRDAGLGNFEVS